MDESHRVTVLLNKATSSSSTREKNTLLLQLRSAANDQLQKLENQTRKNGFRLKELEGREQELSALKQDLESIHSRVTLLNLMKKNNGTDIPDILEQIREIESEISQQEPVDKPHRAAMCLSGKRSDGEKAAKLGDIRMMRVEELIHILQRRIIAVEQNQEYSERVIAEFGSIFGLVDVCKAWQIENKRLKKEEAEFRRDAISRRRLGASIGDAACRSLIVMMQNGLARDSDVLSLLETMPSDMCRAVSQVVISPSSLLKRLGRRASMAKIRAMTNLRPTSSVDKCIEMRCDFDTMCEDPEFVMSTAVNVAQTDPRNNDAPSGEFTVEEAIRETEVQIQIAEEQIRVLQPRVKEARSFKLSADITAGSRVLKMVEQNVRLMQELKVAQAGVDKKTSECDDIIARLNERLKERGDATYIHALSFDPFRQLLRSHNYLRHCQMKNRALISTLLSVCTVMGKELMEGGARSKPTGCYLEPKFEAQAVQRCKEIQVREERERKTKTEKRARLSPSLSFLSVLTEQAEAFGRNRQVASVLSPIVYPEESAAQRARDAFHYAAMLTRTIECGGCLDGANEHHKTFMAKWRELESAIGESMREGLSTFESWNTDRVSTMRQSWTNILVKELVDMETMTDTIEKVDLKTQVSDQKGDRKDRRPLKK